MAAVPSLSPAPALEPLAAPSETEAAERLYELHAERVFSYCQRRLGTREEAEDALQTTFLHALRGLRRGVVPNTEVAWLIKIAHTVCLTRWETARRCAVEVARDPHVLQDMFAARPADHDELIALPEALEQLTENQRRAILMREWLGLSYREIAEELELSQAAVETLIFRARRALAQGLSGDSKPSAGRRALDLCSAVFGIRSLLTGGAPLKVAATLAVVGATLGTGGARERPADRAVSIIPVPAYHDRFAPPPNLSPKSKPDRQSSIGAPSRAPVLVQSPLRRSGAPAAPVPLSGVAGAPGSIADAGVPSVRPTTGSSTAPGNEQAPTQPGSGSLADPRKGSDSATGRSDEPLTGRDGALTELAENPGGPTGSVASAAPPDSRGASREEAGAPADDATAQDSPVAGDLPSAPDGLVPG